MEHSFEDAFRRFKSMFQREGILGILKEKMAYEKPSEKKRRKRREAKERKMLAEFREKNGIDEDRKQSRKMRKRQQRRDRQKIADWLTEEDFEE